MRLTDSSMPPMMGSLRAAVSDQPALSNASERSPPSTPPANPHSAGTEAMKPALRMDMWRCCTR